MDEDFVVENIGKRIAGDVVWSRDVGASLRKWREVFGVSQSELARTLGVSQSVVTDYERNKRNPGSAFIRRYIEALLSIDARRGYKVVKELAKAFAFSFPFIVDMRDFVTPVKLQEVIVAVDGVPVNSSLGNIDVYGYVVTDSIKAITALDGMEFYQFLSISLNKVVVFTKVTSGRSPAIALKIAPVKPKVVVLHRPARMDPLSIYLMDREGVTVIVSLKRTEEDLIASLKRIVPSLGS
ncbi:MAG: helix-turn-helix domain-containing protein [Candidatus Aramenus sp.]|nr:helix-turn-helix domain-containing protein [Candidatus Aramenus sp.]